MLRQAGEQAEEIDLVTPPRTTAEDSPGKASQVDSLPAPLCPDGSPQTAWNPPDATLPPGVSPLDESLPKPDALESQSGEQKTPPSINDKSSSEVEEGGSS